MTDFPAGRRKLLLAEIGESDSNLLRVVVTDMQPSEEVSNSPVGPARRLLPDPSSSVELIWESYIAYAVRNESFFQAEEGELQYGSNLHVRESSAFLDYVAKTTTASPTFPGPFQHWALYTLNHCLDVVSCEQPRIRRIDGATS
ncbi:hypothetical protein ACFSM5_05090 [Lacibacterium aquatile]|uniref:Uncharacterized protein n=1 Tax=Lacibacterium aquatile TaxID=1168082 RepID=A0ABW5DM88_9PROT